MPRAHDVDLNIFFINQREALRREGLKRVRDVFYYYLDASAAKFQKAASELGDPDLQRSRRNLSLFEI